MRILVLNGSPHPDGATADMVAAFEKGAKEAGHDVVTFSVARMNVKGCLGCEYCHNKGEGKCVQQDDMQRLYLKKYDVTDSVPAATLCQVPSPEYGRSATDLTGLRQRFLFPG